MSQHDMVIENQSRTLFRQDIQNALQALASLNSGLGNPAVTYPYELKIDTSPLPTGAPVIYIRNGNNLAWVRWGYVDKDTGQAIPDDATDADTVDGLHANEIGGGFPPGTKMLFYQDTAPPGWTIQNTLNDKLVYVTKGSGAGGNAGGAVHPTGSWTISGLSDAGHTHTLGSHTHTGAGVGLVAGGYPSAWDINYVSSGPTPNLSGSGVAVINSNAAWRPAAYCCIICSKD